MPPRLLSAGQSCQVRIHDTLTGSDWLVLETRDILLEAPNWTTRGDELVLNGAGGLWRLPLGSPDLGRPDLGRPDLGRPDLRRIEINGLPPANNDHVLHPDGQSIFISTYDDWQIYQAPLAGGAPLQITGIGSPPGLWHFLHGVSPDGGQLAFVGLETSQEETGVKILSAEIYTIGSDGQGFRQITRDGVPADGPEYSPDGDWIYFNTEVFTGHAQIARMRTDGSELTRLSFSETVDWFPHLSPDGLTAVYLAYPPGTRGHPANLWVELMVVRAGDWLRPQRVARFFGGQGTINVNSWSPDNRHFAYVTYPVDSTK